MSPRHGNVPDRTLASLVPSTLAIGLVVAGWEVQCLPLANSPLARAGVDLSIQQGAPGDSIASANVRIALLAFLKAL